MARVERKSLAQRLPVALYIPNLIGYVRVLSLGYAAAQDDPGSNKALWGLVLSLALDYIDGPAARKFNMCTRFGDLLDHYTDHITMFYLVYITSASQLNVMVNALHCAVACGYMAVRGHYFKHSAGGNAITRIVEENNYFNMPSMLWNANTVLVPFVKLSYHIEQGLPRKGTTKLIDLFDYLGLCVTLAYTIAVCLPSKRGKQPGPAARKAG